MNQNRSFLASELYAISQGHVCKGDQECYWCAGPCTREKLHDGPGFVLFVKDVLEARRPGYPYMCIGCWLYHRQRISVRSLNNVLIDRQDPRDHSWWITKEGSWNITILDYPVLLKKLLKPPLCFSLSFRDGSSAPQNHIHLAEVNDCKQILADTKLNFTVNNILHSYSIYELELARKQENAGMNSGTRFLARLFRLPDILPELILDKPEKPRERGRPRKEICTADIVKKVIVPAIG